jgi:small subunit ribosomal protein S3
LGHKTHPIGFRLGIIKDWEATWFAAKTVDYRELVKEDLSIRDNIATRYPDAGISKVEIERNSSEVVVTVHTARPGIVIGRGGQRVEDLRKMLETLTNRRARLNVQEIRQPELDAFLVARSVADQLERRIAYRRAIRQAVSRTIQAGAKGVKIVIAGRLGGADIARREKAMEGRVPLHTLRADIDFAIAEAATDFGRIGVKVWLYHGDIIKQEKEPELEDMAPIEVTLSPEESAAQEVAEAEAAAAAEAASVAAAAEMAAVTGATDASLSMAAPVATPQPAAKGSAAEVSPENKAPGEDAPADEKPATDEPAPDKPEAKKKK